MCKKHKINFVFLLALLFFAGFAEADVVSADTFFIFGNHSYGILNLPATPNGIPYLINGNIENYNQRIVLLAGTHRVYWNGGIGFEPIDTAIEVRTGEVRDVVFNFIERKATFFLETCPEEAKIFIDGELAGIGVLFRELKTGEHKISVSARGYRTNQQEITILPDRLVKMNITLEKAVEGDIYFNNKLKELRKLGNFWWNYLNSQPFSIELSAISVQNRIASDKDFRNLLSLFNDGPPIGANHRGVAAFNKIWFAKSLFIISAEYGQGFGGLKYEKPYNIAIDDYFLIYNEFREINPEIFLRSYSGQIGFRAGNDNLSIAILTGYQREKIKISGVTKKTADGKEYFSSLSRQNDSWITTARAVVSPNGENFHPAFFAEMSMTPIKNYDVSGWVGLRCGILIPWQRLKRDD